MMLQQWEYMLLVPYGLLDIIRGSTFIFGHKCIGWRRNGAFAVANFLDG